MFASLVAAGPAIAQTAAKGTAEPTEAQWLERIQLAAERVSYSGTVVYQRGGDVHSSRIFHLYDGRQSQERVQLLDGRPRELVRRGDEVQEFLPELKCVRVSRRARPEAFPKLAAVPAAEVLAMYSVRVGPVERVAGFDGRALTIEPRDRARFGYRLWVEPGSYLLLKAQIVNERREVLEQTAFSEVKIGGPFDRAGLRPSWSGIDWKVERSDTPRLDAAKIGWTLAPPAGFRLLQAVGRGTGKAGEPGRLQLVYTDGLASFSVFIEPLGQNSPPGGATLVDGPTSFMARRVGDVLITVVGEVPPDTVRSVAQSVQPRPAR